LDIKSKEARSRNMSKIRSKDTQPEKYIRSALFRRNHRYRVNSNVVEGHPDIYFPRLNVAIFVHGCYWHRHDGCKYAYIPKSNSEFWLAKFETNKTRDATVYNVLKNHGVRVLIIWECTVRKMMCNADFHNKTIVQIENFILRKKPAFSEI